MNNIPEKICRTLKKDAEEFASNENFLFTKCIIFKKLNTYYLRILGISKSLQGYRKDEYCFFYLEAARYSEYLNKTANIDFNYSISSPVDSLTDAIKEIDGTN